MNEIKDDMCGGKMENAYKLEHFIVGDHVDDNIKIELIQEK
jgi:hypothetical protein